MIVFTQWGGLSKWRSTPTSVAKEALRQNALGNMDPDSGNLRASMLMGELDKGVVSACDTISLVKEKHRGWTVAGICAGLLNPEP